jgi:hypothetical protein
VRGSNKGRKEGKKETGNNGRREVDKGGMDVNEGRKLMKEVGKGS